jgi:hypothetical protein
MDKNCLNYGSSICHDYDCDDECPGRMTSDRIKGSVPDLGFWRAGEFEVALEELAIRKVELNQAIARAESTAVMTVDHLTKAYDEAVECYQLMSKGGDNILQKLEEKDKEIAELKVEVQNYKELLKESAPDVFTRKD